MKPVYRSYAPANLMSIREFMIDSYQKTKKPFNFTIDRLNFGYSLDRSMHSVSKELWEKRVGIWEQNEKIVGTVHGEGSGGYALLQINPEKVGADTIKEMLRFAEANLADEEDGKRMLSVNIPEDDELRQAVAKQSGYLKTQGQEPFAQLAITSRLEVELPQGFGIKTGDNFTARELGLAHANAFGYNDEPEYVKRSPVGYERMHKTPDYRADQDLYVVSASGEIVLFCTIWLDNVNKIGMLEPVGTHPGYRKLGLAKSVINECINRVADKGATKVWVGSKQPFYLAIGFEHVYNHEIWEKKL